MKIIPTAIKIDSLGFSQDVCGDTGQEYNKHIHGKVTIEFVTAGNFSEFIVEDGDTFKVVGLDDLIIDKILNGDIEL